MTIHCDLSGLLSCTFYAPVPYACEVHLRDFGVCIVRLGVYSATYDLNPES